MTMSASLLHTTIATSPLYRALFLLSVAALYLTLCGPYATTTTTTTTTTAHRRPGVALSSGWANGDLFGGVAAAPVPVPVPMPIPDAATALSQYTVDAVRSSIRAVDTAVPPGLFGDLLTSPASSSFPDRVSSLPRPRLPPSPVPSASSSGTKSESAALADRMSIVSTETKKSDALYRGGKKNWHTLQVAREAEFDLQAAQKTGTQFRLATANVAGFKQPAPIDGLKGVSTFTASLSKFKQMDSDVLVLQEFRQPTTAADVAAWEAFKREMGYTQVLQKSNLPFRIVDKREQMILSRLTMTKTATGRTWQLPFLRGTRSYVMAEVEKDGHKMLVATTHGTFGGSNGRAREQQFSQILNSKAWQANGNPRIIAGDINESGAGVHDIMTQKGLTDAREIGDRAKDGTDTAAEAAARPALLPTSSSASLASADSATAQQQWEKATYWRGGAPIDSTYATPEFEQAYVRQINWPSSLSDHNPQIIDYDLTKMTPTAAFPDGVSSAVADTMATAPKQASDVSVKTVQLVADRVNKGDASLVTIPDRSSSMNGAATAA